MSDDLLQGAIIDYTQSEYADRFVIEYGDRFRYIPPEKLWLYYDSKRWREDAYDTAFHFCETMCRTVLDETSEAIETDSGAKANPARKTARERCGAGNIEAIIRIARTRRPIVTQRYKFDTDPFQLNVQNGTFDLREGKLRKHSPNDMITKITEAAYHKDATGPTFDDYFTEVQPDEHWREQIMRAFGYALKGTYGEFAFIHVGMGGNGKSTLLTVVQRALGDYAVEASWKVLNRQAEDEHATILAELEGRRLSVVQMGGHTLGSEQLRTLVAEPTFKARKMHQDSRTIYASHTLHISQNDPPPLKQLDSSTRRRIIVFEWKVTVPEPDDELPLKLSAELDYVLLLMLRGYHAWSIPDMDRSAAEQYFEQNSMYRFFTEEMTVDDKAAIPAGVAHAAYAKWCKGLGEKPESETAFGRFLSGQGIGRRREIVEGRKVYVRPGIRLRVDPTIL